MRVTRSVNLETEQNDWINEKHINLSSFVREKIDELRKGKGVE